MKVRELELCQIQHWYPRFSAISFKTLIHPLPEPFVSYLLEDGLFLPRCATDALPKRPKPSPLDIDYQRWPEEDDDEDEEVAAAAAAEDEDSRDAAADADRPHTPPSFPQLEATVLASIRTLGGAVFPKLNWSSPKDSAWISPNGSLKCTNFGEIALLLKASDTLVHDLMHAFDSCEDSQSRTRPETFVLALRKWHNLRPEMEFRGFVRKGLLVGVSQREVTSFYPAVVDSMDVLEEAIFKFFLENLCEAFDLEDYTFDCYVTRGCRHVKLVDFNPWGAFTLPLLFSWDELDACYEKFSAALSDKDDKEGISEVSEWFSGDNSWCETEETLESPKEENITDSSRSNVEVRSVECEAQLNECLENKLVLESQEVGSKTANEPQYKDPEVSSNLNSSQYRHSEKGQCAVQGTEMSNGCHVMGKASLNTKLRECNLKAEFRIVKSEQHVQPNLRMGGGVPYDYINTGPGSPWDEFLRKATEESNQQIMDMDAGG